MSPQAKRSAVKNLGSGRSYFEHGACKLVGISRSSARYPSKKSIEDIDVRRSIRELAHRHDLPPIVVPVLMLHQQAEIVKDVW